MGEERPGAVIGGIKTHMEVTHGIPIGEEFSDDDRELESVHHMEHRLDRPGAGTHDHGASLDVRSETPHDDDRTEAAADVAEAEADAASESAEEAVETAAEVEEAVGKAEDAIPDDTPPSVKAEIIEVLEGLADHAEESAEVAVESAAVAEAAEEVAEQAESDGDVEQAQEAAATAEVAADVAEQAAEEVDEPPAPVHGFFR
jgi:hypothetical protein